MIKKYISNTGTILELGDFFGGGEDESISFMEKEGNILTITTTLTSYEVTLQPGDYLLDREDKSQTIKSKYDKEDT